MTIEMTIDVTTPDDDDEPFPITRTGNDADWRVLIPAKRDLLSYGQAIKDWRCSDADLAGLIYSNRVSAYKLESDQLSPFNWFGFRGDNWRTQLLTLMFYPAPDFDPESSRYLDYPAALALLKKHNPKLDAVTMLVQETGAATGELNWNLLAINLTGKRLTPDNLPDCIYIMSQVQTLIDRIKVKPERTRKNGDYALTKEQIEDYHRRGLTQKKIEALGVKLCRVRKVTADMKHCPRGPKPK